MYRVAYLRLEICNSAIKKRLLIGIVPSFLTLIKHIVSWRVSNSLKRKRLTTLSLFQSFWLDCIPLYGLPSQETIITTNKMHLKLLSMFARSFFYNLLFFFFCYSWLGPTLLRGVKTGQGYPAPPTSQKPFHFCTFSTADSSKWPLSPYLIFFQKPLYLNLLDQKYATISRFVFIWKPQEKLLKNI